MLLQYERGNRNNSFNSPFLQDNRDAFEELEQRVCSKTVAAKALAGQTRLNIAMQELAVRRRSLCRCLNLVPTLGGGGGLRESCFYPNRSAHAALAAPTGRDSGGVAA